MEKDTPKEAPAADYTVNLEEHGSYRFGKPTVPQIDRYLARAQGKTTSLSMTFTLELAVAEDRDKWAAALQRRPGLATAVVQHIMDDLGFLGGAS